MTVEAVHPARLFAAGLLLSGPTALAFFSGGFFDRPRLWATVAALCLVAACALTMRRPLPSGRPALVAGGGLALLTLLSGLSVLWAPRKGVAFDDAQRLLLYLAFFVAAAAVLRPRRLARWVEPAVAFGGLVVIAYGLSERFLPTVVELTHGAASAGRLDQPLTYWNAMGVLAALAFIASVRLAGDRARSAAVRTVAAIAGAPLGLGIYLSFSRGALGTAAVGLVVLVLLAPNREQLRGIVIVGGAGVLAGIMASPFDALGDLDAALGTRRTQGAAMLGLLALLSIAAGAAQLLSGRREAHGRATVGRLALPTWAIGLGIAAVLGAAAAAFVATSGEQIKGADAARLRSVDSNRYAYWRVAVEGFAGGPVAGVGSGGFGTDWVRERKLPEFVRDAHSLYIETAAELGVLGLVALGLFLLGLAACARGAWRRDPALAAGPATLVAAWAFACALDWHWEMPAVTLPVLLAAAVLITRAGDYREDPTGSSSRTRRPALAASGGSESTSKLA